MTDRNVQVEPAPGPAVEEQTLEIVERKGIGHPDSVCDGVAEAVSQALARVYLDRVGRVLHFNTDETQLVAGSAAPAFGGGEVLEPIYLLIVGRATKSYEGTNIPAESVAVEAARDYLDETFPDLDVGTDVIVDVDLGEGSGDLQQVFGEDGTVPMANDTSYGVGYAPLSETERIVLETERQLNGDFGAENPAIGQDVKVMAKREDDQIAVTVAVAAVDAHVPDIEAYEAMVESVREEVLELAREITDRSVEVHVNTADDLDSGAIYLTTTGTSAEQGDDGSVGRGNRANGLITPNRPMSLEATSGKNPVNHIGKIYNLLSTEIARAVYERVDAVRQIQIRLLSQIGQPIDQPHLADAHVVTEAGTPVSAVEDDVSAVIDDELDGITDLTRSVIEGEQTTF
ncbi:methionine adenosyltransferase [Halococcoides cellulosivorans]|uniref:S-adenosylmethionine synthase n=1 Tax=Halococcoides cellulosivorans TaxID=1679096 RepID=A0A2R4X1K5_9EURY|nr:methionine adenosyltransferase [Halococcoides cellulosivorans]AWB27670.1 S-adenosylmethionine synthetase [Halococcoides cellulosivorans]